MVNNAVFAEAKTVVFWDVLDCPIPEGLTPGMIYQNIRTALTNLGYIGGLSITAFVDEDTTHISLDDFESVGIKLEFVVEIERARGKAQSRYSALSDHMFDYRSDNREPSNYLVISEFISASTIDTMVKLNDNVLLALPEDGYAEITDDISSVWFWSSLSVGGTPMGKPAYCPSCRRFRGAAADCTESSHGADE